MATDPKQKSNPFAQLKVTRDNRRQSLEWFNSNIKALRRASYQPKTLLTATNHKTRYLTIGRMVMFQYDPKYKEELPFYDTFPIIFVIDNKVSSVGGTGFYGVNLHYLPPPIRIKLLHTLYDIATNDRFDATTRLRITYDILVRLSKAKNIDVNFAFKHYLHSHVQSDGFIEVPPSAWPMTALLPVERFEKHTKQYVWQQYKSRTR